MSQQGLILFDGPSQLDGEPIICIATFKTENPKTGPLVQTWILRKDISPVEAVESGDDESVCGNCIHRGTSCYVNIHYAPNCIWDAYQRGCYRKVTSKDLKLFAGQNIRLGSYGDPVAVPFGFWLPIIQTVAGWTGYTHQWRDCDQQFKNILMASTDSYTEYREALHRGWRSFRVKLSEEKSYKHEIVCPASKEAGQKTTCAKCKLCVGNAFGKRRGIKSIVIDVHGGVFPPMMLRKMREKSKTLRSLPIVA